MNTNRAALSLSLAATWCALLVVVSTPAFAQERQAVRTRAVAPVTARLLGRLPETQRMNLAISLPLRNQDQLNMLLQQLEDPASPNYHHYLSVAQFTERFGPTFDEYQQVIGYAQAHGFTVTRTATNRMLVNVSAAVADVEHTFQVAMQVYQHPQEKRTFFAPSVAPTIDADIPILGVSGLTNFTLPHSLLAHAVDGGVHSNQTGSGEGGQFLGSDFRAAYYGSGPLTGAGQAIALAELGQWNLADVQAYFTAVNQPLNVPIMIELLGGTSGACPGACNDGEEANDIIQIISMAPGSPVLIVYEDTSGNADIDIFNAYASDNLAKQMSFSFGIGDGNAAADEQAFQEFHAQGQNFFVASGDEGANLGDGGWPGYSSNVTDVGGTELTTASAGGAWSSETGWSSSGTGWCDSSKSSTPCFQSTFDAIPSYQQALSSTISAAGGSTAYRDLPDVSADADTDSFWCASGTCQTGLGGTSLAAPRWAGFVALANEQGAANGDTIGFLNPTVYTLGQGPNYDTAFHDIKTGSNPSGSTVPSGFIGSFTAVTGFDMVTGWGTPNGQGMIDALAPTSTTNPYFALSASPGLLNLTPGGTPGTATISLTAGNSFAGTVSLSTNVLGSPAGVSASLNPTSISGSETSTLTVTTTGSAPAGTLMIAVTGTSSSGLGTQPAYVTVGLPDFALSVSPSAIYLNQNSTATPTVTVNSQNNFGGTVNLSVSALPSGVTGTLNPTSTSSTSTLTLTATSTAPTVANDYITVYANSGSISPLNAPYAILSVSAATGTGGTGTPVDLSSAFNLTGIYTDGSTFSTGLDGSGSAYSSNILTANRILNGVQFDFGPANSPNVVGASAQTISLPSGQFTTLQLIAASFDGPLTSQTVTVTYSDGTTSTFSQSFSDWCSCNGNTPGPGHQPGESFAVVMPYRDLGNGMKDERVFNLYAYTFVLNSAKTVKTLSLPPKPSKGDVVVLAATLTTQSLGTPVGLSSGYNVAGLYDDGVTFSATGGMDGGGNNCTLQSGCADAYSAQQLGLTSNTAPTLLINGTVFNLGAVNTTDCTSACVADMVNLNPGVTITLTAGQQTAYTTLTMLGTAVQGSHKGTVTVTYTSGNPQTFSQTFSDWCNFQNNTHESVAVEGFSRANSDGTLNTGASCNLYSYSYALDSTRTVQSIAVANTDNPKTNFSLVLAITLSGNTNTSPTPSYSLSAGTANPPSINAGASSTAAVTVTPANGYTGAVTLSCSISPVVSGANAPTCSFGNSSPVSVTSAAATATLTFTTVGPSGNIMRRAGQTGTRLSTGLHHGYADEFLAVSLLVPGIIVAAAGLSSKDGRRRKIFVCLLLSPMLISVALFPACGGGGNSGGGGGGGGCSIVPSAPTGLAASSTTSSGTTLNWSAATAGSGCTISTYVVYENGMQIATSNDTTYNVTGLTANTQYSFTVAATDSDGTSAQSTAASVTTASNGTPSGTYTITITGQDGHGVTQTGAGATVTVTVN